MAVYPIASGHPDLSGNYIPTLYAALLLIEFYKDTVFGAIANTKYEGQIKSSGDKVEIRTLPTITVRDYVKGQDLDYENPPPSKVTLNIDQGKYWALAINTVDKKQSDIDFVKKWAEHASKTLKINIDSDILAAVYSQVHAANTGATAGLESGSINLGVSGTPFQLTASTILAKIVDCAVVLDEQNVPDEGRYIVLPPVACGLIKKSDLKDASITGDNVSILRNGKVGMIDRFTIFCSNNIATATDTVKVWHSIFGQTEALTFASQMVEHNIIPNPKDFGDLLRALQVYGFKVVKPEAMGHLYFKL